MELKNPFQQLLHSDFTLLANNRRMTLLNRRCKERAARRRNELAWRLVILATYFAAALVAAIFALWQSTRRSSAEVIKGLERELLTEGEGEGRDRDYEWDKLLAAGEDCGKGLTASTRHLTQRLEIGE